MGLIKFIKDIFLTDYAVDNSSKLYFTPFGISDVDESFRKKEFSTGKLKILSIVEINKYIHLPIKYQYIVLYDYHLRKNLKKFYEIKDSKELNSDNIAIFHYVSLNPWKFFNTPYVKLWDNNFLFRRTDIAIPHHVLRLILFKTLGFLDKFLQL